MPRPSSFKSFITIHNRTVPSIFAAIGKDKKDPTPAPVGKKEKQSIPVGYGSIGHHNDVSFEQPKPLKEYWEDAVPSSEFEKKSKEEQNKHMDIDYEKHYSNGEQTSQRFDKAFHPSMEEEYKKVDNPAFISYTGESSGINQHLIKSHIRGLYPHYPETSYRLGYDDDFLPPNAYDNKRIHAHELLNHIDAAIKEHTKPTPEDTHVYTGIGAKLDIQKLREAGHDKVHFPAFTSTSHDPTTAQEFAYTNQNKKYKEMVRIHLPKGSTHGVQLGSASRMDHEREFLLNRGKTLKFKGEPRILVSKKPWDDEPTHMIIHDAEIVDHEHENENKPTETPKTTVKESNMKTFKRFNEQSTSAPPAQVMDPNPRIIFTHHGHMDQGNVKHNFGIDRYEFGFNKLPHKKSKVDLA